MLVTSACRSMPVLTQLTSARGAGCDDDDGGGGGGVGEWDGDLKGGGG